MGETSMARFRCWSADEVGQTIFSDIGNLASDEDALFLAAHTPIELEHLKGHESDSSASGEAQVLEALTSKIGDLKRNTLIAVTGSSGSGKSHVVRWIHSHLPSDEPRYHVLYVPRAVQTLRELLRRIIDGLPGVDGTSLMTRVDSAISNVRPGELQARLINDMKIALDWTLEDHPAYDGETADEAAAREDRNSILGTRNEDGGRRDGLADLLEVPQIKEALLRPEGRLSKLVQSYFDETSRRDENEEIFTSNDLPLRERGVFTALTGRMELTDLWKIIKSQPDDALQLLDEALRVALPKTVGLRTAGGDTLDSLFRDSRKALRARHQELVLLFEDLAQFGLVDGELYDQFVTQPGDDLAPLRVVFAVTDGVFGRMERTVRTRVEHEFHVGGSALVDPAQFVGRYLNLARVGRDKTQSLWTPSSDRHASVTWMANACDTRQDGQECLVRDKCHASFGAVHIEGLGQVGLYPYNSEALRRAMAHFGHDPTPREVLDDCVYTNLVEADQHIGAGDYPHERTRRQFNFEVHKEPDALKASIPSSDPERNYRALVIWGNESPLPASLLEAFSLDSLVTPVPATPWRPSPKQPEPVELPNPLLPLFQWRNGADLSEEDVNYYRDLLRTLTADRLQLDQYLVHLTTGSRANVILERLFNRTSFVIEGPLGRTPAPQSIRFDLARNAQDARVMAAARWFRDHGHFDPSRAAWQWPEGYDPAPLMVELETRLDEWADEVRTRFLERIGSDRPAQNAIGLRAIALAASGHNPSKLGTTAMVLRPLADSILRSTEIWVSVNGVAARIVSSIKAEEYVGEFAAVRQGDGGPQLIDPLGLNEAIEEFLANPKKALTELAESKGADPVLVQYARQLLEAMLSATSAEASLAARAYETVTMLLEGQSPAKAAEAAADVGLLAREAGFFRPADKWAVFHGEIDVLSAATVEDPATADGSDLGAMLRGQRATRNIDQLARAVLFVKQVMDDTKKECERGAGAGGDIATLRTDVQSQVEKLAKLVNSLGSEV